MTLNLLSFFLILFFVIFCFWWNKKWKDSVLDEREANIRLMVRGYIARCIEVSLAVLICFHFFFKPLSGFEVLMIIGSSGVFAELFGNWYLRRLS